MSMFAGSMAKGFNEGYRKSQQTRRDVARMFEQFRANNPEATYEDFQQFLGSISGGGMYNPTSDAQLRRYAQEGAVRKRNRLHEEALARVQKEQAANKSFEEAFRMQALAQEDPATALALTIETMTDDPTIRANWQSQYAPKAATLQAQMVDNALQKVFETRGNALARDDRKNINLETLFGGKVSKRLTEGFDSMLFDRQESVNDRIYQNAVDDVKLMATNTAELDATNYVRDVTFYGPDAEKWRKKLANFIDLKSRQVGRDKQSQLRKDVTDFLDRKERVFGQMYERNDRDIDMVKANATEEAANRMGVSPAEVKPIVDSVMGNYTDWWDRRIDDFGNDFFNGAVFEDIQKVAMAQGWSRQDLRDELNRQNVNLSESQFDRAYQLIGDSYKRSVEKSAFDRNAKFAGDSITAVKTLEEARDKPIADNIAFQMGDKNARDLPQFQNVGRIITAKYSISDPYEFNKRVAEKLDEVKDPEDLTETEVIEIFEGVAQEMMAKNDGTVMLDTDRAKLDRSKLRAQQMVWESSSLNEYVEQANAIALNLTEKMEATVADLANKPPLEWTPDDINAVRAVQQDLFSHGRVMLEDFQSRVQQPRAWLTDFDKAYEVEQQKEGHEDFKRIVGFGQLLADKSPDGLRANFTKVAQLANMLSKQLPRLNSSNPNERELGLNAAREMLPVEQFKPFARHYRGQGLVNYPNNKKWRNLTDDQLTHAIGVANDPIGALNATGNTEQLQTQLSQKLNEYSTLLFEAESFNPRKYKGTRGESLHQRESKVLSGKVKLLEAEISALVRQLEGA